MENLKRIVLITLRMAIVLFSISTTAQSDGSQYVVNHDNSPEGSSFNFSSNAVDYYTGKVNTTIPLHTYKGRELDLPMSLSYNSDGVQVEELANNTGLGWSLNFGGRITATINKEVDNVYSQASQYARDIYTLQLPGITEYFLMEYHQPMAQINPAIGAEMRGGPSANWIIHMPDGSKYFFENVREDNTIFKSYGSNYPFASSWLLTKIISKNGLDTYRFEYNELIWANPVPNRGEGYYQYNYGTNAPNADYSCTQRSPTTVYHNDEKIISFTYTYRDDMRYSTITGKNALEFIYFSNYKELGTYKKIGFSYSYFGNTTSSNYLDKRLKLDELTFYGINFSTSTVSAGDKYKFEYDNPDKVPPITSMAQDYLGLYNGMTSNTNLIEGIVNYNTPVKRAYNNMLAQYGILKRITYPSKGYTDFEFEQNRLNDKYEYYYKGDSYRTDPVDVAFIGYHYQLNPSVSDTGTYCLGNSNQGPHPSMAGDINFYNYNGNVQSHYGSYLSVFTTLLTVTAADTFYFNTPGEGRGVYLIQTLDGVTCTTFNTRCGPIQNTNLLGPYTVCLRPTNTISYAGSNNQPEGYVKGGTTRVGYGDVEYESVYLQPGNYQVTLWSYMSTSANPPSARLRLYKKVQTFVPPHLVNTNIPGTLADGFRIKSMTTYSGPGIFAGKKEFKYNNGKLFHHHNINYASGDKISSQGYLYSDVVFYQSVTERDINLSGTEFNGSTEYIYGNADDTAGEIGPYNTVSHKGIEKEYHPTWGGSGKIKIDQIHNSDLKEKKIYGSDGILRYSEKHRYGFGNYVNTVWVWGGMRLDGTEVQPEWTHPAGIYPIKLSTTVTNYPSLDKGISVTTNYYHGDPDTSYYYTDTMLIYTETVHSTGTEYNSFYRSPILNNIGFRIASYSPFGTTVEDENGLIKHSVMYSEPLAVNTPSLFKTVTSSTDGRTDFEYDSAKNMVTKIKYTPGTLTPASYEAYIYGYSNRFPVAKIVGRKYSELSNTLVTNIINAANVPVSATAEQTLRNRLNVLRNNYPDCQITSCTYDPAYGVTSMTDPKGYTLFYEYDIFGRLTFTREGTTQANSQIISEKQYNNRPQ